MGEWLREHDKSKNEINTEGADLVLALSAALSYRRHAAHLHEADLALVADAVGGNPFG